MPVGRKFLHSCKSDSSRSTPVIHHTKSDSSHTSRNEFSINSSELGKVNMRIRYHWQIVTPRQRALMEYLLLDEMERQSWYAIVHLKLWKSEGLICIQ